MPIDVAPALILAAAVVVLIFGVGAEAWSGLRRLAGRRPGGPEGDGSAEAMDTERRGDAAPQSIPGSTSRASAPNRMVTVGAWRATGTPVPRATVRGGLALNPEPSPDPRRLLWRDTAVVTVAIGLMVFVSSSLPRSTPDGAVLGETFPAILGNDPTASVTPSGVTASPGSSASDGANPSPDAASTPPTSQPAAAGATPRPGSTAKPAPPPSPTAGSTPAPSPPPPTAEPNPSPTPEPSPSPTPEASPTPTPTSTPTPTPTPTPPPTAEPTPTPKPSHGPPGSPGPP